MNYQFANIKPVKLTWLAVSGATFTLERGDGTINGWSVLYVGPNNEFLDLTSLQGFPYVYRVNSDVDATWGELSVSVPVEIPSNFIVTPNGSGGINVNFDSIPGIQYDIRRSTNGNQYSLLVGGITYGNYIDNAVTVGSRYWYRVSAKVWLNQSTFVSSPLTNPQSALA